MGHPDQHTPEDHRTSSRKGAPEPNLADDLAEDLGEEELKERAETGTDVRTPEPDEKRIGEAGNQYVGRTGSDQIKDEPRPDKGTEDET